MRQHQVEAGGGDGVLGRLERCAPHAPVPPEQRPQPHSEPHLIADRCPTGLCGAFVGAPPPRRAAQCHPPRRPDHGRLGADRRAAAHTAQRPPASCVALAATCAWVWWGGSRWVPSEGALPQLPGRSGRRLAASSGSARARGSQGAVPRPSGPAADLLGACLLLALHALVVGKVGDFARSYLQ